MGASTFFKRILSSPLRSYSKGKILQKVENSVQENRDVINVHRMDPDNIGDMFSAPHHYFEPLKNKALDIYDYKSLDNKITENWIQKISQNSLIIGGGGLLNRPSFERQMMLFQKLTENGKKTVLWGVGHNSKFRATFGKISGYNINENKFGLSGTRDYSLAKNWVPCVSCLHPSLENKFTADQETGIVFHKNTFKKNKLTSRFKDYPVTSNTSNIEELIKFIGRSEHLITDSYHAMYWGILLEKKVLLIPNTSKFFDFKYNPVFTTFENCINDLKKSQAYSGVLEECREINREFAGKVFNYLNL